MKNIKSTIIIAIIILSLSIFLLIYYNYSLQRPLPIIYVNNNNIKIDKFGIKEIYRSKPGGEEWYINMDYPNHDKRTDPQTTLIRNNNIDGDISWKIQNTEVRYNVFTSSGYKPQLITTLNQTELAKKGYMQSPNDWKNVEMTGYFKINSFTSSEKNGAAHIELVARGGKNTNDNTLINGLPKQCESTTYHSNTYETGRVKFEKDLMHTQGYTTEDKQRPNAIKEPLLGRWIGIKAVFYNLDNNSVKLEQYIDGDTDNNWHRVLSFIDDGHWGGGTPNCGGSDTQVITWGGPIGIFRWDNIDDMDIKNFSIREIQPS
jgi:hypothetical protein